MTLDKKFLKKIKGDASFRSFYRKKNRKKVSIIVSAKKEKKKNLLIYDAINKLLIKNGIKNAILRYRWQQGKSIKEALDIADSTFAAIMKSNDLDPYTIFNEEGSIKKEVKDEAIYRINMCSKAIKESMPSLLKQTNGEVASAERIEEETKTFPYYWLDSIENMTSKPTIATLSASGAGQPIFMHSIPNHLYQMLYGGISTGEIRKQHEARTNLLSQVEKLASA